jgi:TonB family protein
MAKNNSYHLSSEQLENYLLGKHDAPTMHHLEKHLLSCVFCANALEGLKAMPQQQIPSNVKLDLKRSLQERIKPITRKSNIFLWQNIGIAASIVGVMLLGSLFLKQPEKQVALKEENTSPLPKKNKPIADVPIVKKTEINPISKVATLPKISSESPKNSVEVKGSANSVLADKQTGFEETPVIAAKSIEKESEDAIPAREAVAKLEANKDKKEEIAEKPAAPTGESKTNPSTKSEVAFAPNQLVVDPVKSAEKLNINKAPSLYNDNKGKKNTNESLAINGKINDESGAGLPGVNVQVKGQNIGTQTDLGGNFFLNNVKKGDVLNLNYIGMQPQEVVVQANQTAMNVVLKDDQKALAEVAVVGYDLSNKETSETPSQVNTVEPNMGWRAFKQYIKENLQYPAQAQNNKIKGRVVAKVKILPTGKIENIELVKKLGYGCDEEAIRLLRNIAWKSNKSNTTSVRVSIRFGK